MNQQHCLIHSTVFRRAAASGEAGHALCLGVLCTVLSPAWLGTDTRAMGLTALWGAEGPMPSQHWRCFQLSLVSIHASQSKLTGSGGAVSAQCQPQPWGRWLNVWGLSFWSVLLSLAGCQLGLLCYCPRVSPEVDYAHVQWKLDFYLHAFPWHFQEIKPYKPRCGHDHRVITVPLELYWVYRYTYLCLSVNPSICFQALKLQDIFYICYWEQMCPVPIIFYWRMSGLWEVEWWMPFNLNYYFLHSIAAAGRLQLLIETLKIFKYFTDQNLSCALSFGSFLSWKLLWLCCYFILGLELVLSPNTLTRGTENMLTCFRVSSNPETKPCWGRVTTNSAVCPADAWPFWQDLALPIGLHPPLPFPKRSAPRDIKWKVPKAIAKYFKMVFPFWTMDVAVTKVDGKTAGRGRAQESGLCINPAQ